MRGAVWSVYTAPTGRKRGSQIASLRLVPRRERYGILEGAQLESARIHIQLCHGLLALIRCIIMLARALSALPAGWNLAVCREPAQSTAG